MTQTLTPADRLRIERAVWTLDRRLQALPRKSRVAKRRELRTNLGSAAADVGTAAAVRRLGNQRRLAAEYLVAEYGEWGPRPSWVAGLAFVLLTQAFLAWLLDAGTSAFKSGVVAADPHATGTFHWHAIDNLLAPVAVRFVNGRAIGVGVGGAFTPLVYAVLLAGLILVGRLWRLLPAWRRRQADITDGR